MSPKAPPADDGGIRWAGDVAKHDYPAAQRYLAIRFDDRTARRAIRELHRARITLERVNDVLRACRLPPLAEDDPGVRRDRAKVEAGEELSPILLVRMPDTQPAEIADGYHRVSLAYHEDPFGFIPARVATVVL